MESVNVEKCLGNGKVLQGAIMDTLRVAVLCNAGHLVDGLHDAPEFMRRPQLQAAERYIQLALSMAMQSRDDWTYGEWSLIQTCLINMTNTDGTKAHRNCLPYALDYVEKQMERADYTS